MPENERMQLFEDQPVRTAWEEQQEEWYFSAVDGKCRPICFLTLCCKYYG